MPALQQLILNDIHYTTVLIQNFSDIIMLVYGFISLSAGTNSILCVHCVQKKTPTYVFNYNSGISWLIFIFYILMETGRNTLQQHYLTAWWRHNCVTSNVTKVYFIELKINIG